VREKTGENRMTLKKWKTSGERLKEKELLKKTGRGWGTKDVGRERRRVRSLWKVL